MYEAYYSLEDSPFVLTPDPRFLLRSKGHHEISRRAALRHHEPEGAHGAGGRRGHGQDHPVPRSPARSARQRAERAHPQPASVRRRSHRHRCSTISAWSGAGPPRGELMATLSQHLLAAGSEGKTVLVIVDEAQQMSVECPEQVRILSNLETPTRKLLQILLVGQPGARGEAAARRAAPARPAHRHPVLPQAPAAQGDLPLRRAPHARGRPARRAARFTRASLAQIYKFSRGIPRVINLVCDRALMAGFSSRVREITPRLVTGAARNLEGGRHGRQSLHACLDREGAAFGARPSSRAWPSHCSAWAPPRAYWGLWRVEGLRAAVGNAAHSSRRRPRESSAAIPRFPRLPAHPLPSASMLGEPRPRFPRLSPLPL